MQVILLKDIKNLGTKNSVVNVKDGHAMNFLIPRKMAVAATDDKIKDIENKENKSKKQEIKKSKELDEIINKLKDKKIIIKKQASDKGKLFASLSTGEILTAIQKEYKVSLDKSSIKLKEHIKDVGEHDVELEIGNKNIEIKIEVVEK